MTEMSALIEPEFDSAPGRDNAGLEAIAAVDRSKQRPEPISWNVELAREWAFLGGD
jgi:hypothetical protein